MTPHQISRSGSRHKALRAPPGPLGYRSTHARARMTMSMWSRLRGWAGGGGLDPRRVQQVRTRFEIESGYAEYQRFCRSRFRRALPPASAPIVEQGRQSIGRSNTTPVP